MADWPLAEPEPVPPLAESVWCWRIRLDAMDDALEGRLWLILDPDERVRASRFHRPEDRRRSAAARAGLRLVLAAALGRNARDISLAASPTGKPELRDRALAFNISHSGSIVLIALSSGTSVGADVEELRAIPERVELAERFFHPGEVADLSTLPQADIELAFFRCWTRKEAVVKALGLGLSLGLHEFRVSCLPGVRPELLIAADASPPAVCWSMFDLAPAPAHIGAIAVPQQPMTLVCRTLDLRACC